jgi:GMC oxidoreductase
MVSGLKIARKIGRAKALAPWRAAEALPGPGADTDDALRHYADQTMGSYFHPVGTCRMGVDDMSVVDCELRVHGISGLRIADGSIMPSIVSGNTKLDGVRHRRACRDPDRPVTPDRTCPERRFTVPFLPVLRDDQRRNAFPDLAAPVSRDGKAAIVPGSNRRDTRTRPRSGPHRPKGSSGAVGQAQRMRGTRPPRHRSPHRPEQGHG